MERALVVVALVACSGGKKTGQVDGIGYALDLPTEFSVDRETSDSIRWRNKAGLEIEISSSHLPRPCEDTSNGEGSGGIEDDDGKRETSVDVHRCLDGRRLRCSAHRRAGITPAEHDAGLAICRTLTIR